MISAPVTAFAVVPIATANYRAAILCSGTSRHSATQLNSVAIGGIADIGRFSASNDVQRLTHQRHLGFKYREGTIP
jgi:hypothetical protein